MTEKTERRGRPAEQPFVQPEKWTREFYEVPTKPELGTKTVFYYDNSKMLMVLIKQKLLILKDYKHE
jgi:hypothetical protein